MGRPKIILFDLDGTLVDTKEIVAKVYAEGLKRMGLSVPPISAIVALSGLSTHETGRRLGVPEDRLDEIDQWFWVLFRQFCEDPLTDPHFFNEVPKLLRHLHDAGIKLGIVTSNESRNARLLLKKGGVEKYFTAVIGFREVNNPKPSGEPIKVAVNEICQGKEINYAEDVWMVGDTESDLLSAQDAGVRPLILSRDISTLQELKILLDKL